ncbi:nucleolar complex-associated protein [Necator americanus]|uniref:NOC3-like protein n=1 Tax=Necator americanus TaxID=51031 RepID=W2T3B4_NECAM|nr:nucleolar complex-associated protein [Necator americanus]ETN75467.1 nucleolar complex-associated protein [Necator americanus]
MGFASASREEKLRMMKTSHTRKTTKKLNRLAKKKKLSRNVIEGLKDIKARRSKDSRKRAVNVEDDWIADREAHFDEEIEENLPLDMLDADIDWENSAFAGAKRRHNQKHEDASNDDGEMDDADDIEGKRRKFQGQLNDNVEEMLPIKLKDFSSLSASELLAKRKELIDQFKQTISTFAHQLLTNPQENIYKLRDLFRLCQGEKVHSLVRETVQKLALVSMLQVVSEVCTTLHQVFREDLHLRISLFGARSIASLVTKRKGHVPPSLIATFLFLNIKEVKNEDKKSGKGRIFAKRALIKKEKANKTARKYKKQLDKLEADLKELDAAETLSTKVKTATETMKYVFQCYFSVLKRVPNVALLEPVLEGLNKFAHLLGVEFFEDIVLTMEGLVDKEHLRLLDQLYCINTVFVILSGDGQLLNVDPSRFYRSVYHVLNQLPFERRPDLRKKQMIVVSKALDLMINERRKQLPLSRVAAFVKRLLSIATVMDDPSALCLVALVRSFFIAHSKLVQLVEEDDAEGGAGGVFRSDIDDPDVSNALSSNVRTELKILTRRRHRSLNQFAHNILHSVPSTGPHKLNPQLTSV